MLTSPETGRRCGALISVCLVALCSTAADAQPVSATASVSGTIVDATGAAVRGVEVLVLGARLSVFSGERGEFKFSSVAAGAHRIVTRRAGYRADTTDFEFAPGDTVALWLEMKRIAVMLDEVEVTDTYESPRLRGFEQRRLHSIGGRFVTPADIKAQSPTETSDLLRRVMGVRLADSMHVLIPVSNRGDKIVRVGTQLMSVPCVMRIGLNGFITDPNFSMNLISPMDIHGIEIYNGPASIPPEFNRTAADLYCGLIMIWTRSGS
ncbi:MAG: hypothetical protein JWL61_2819 [Gemmatimonadetes bacterium]|nr:hypothetical protein [Gemmatimonadota bacterium]